MGMGQFGVGTIGGGAVCVRVCVWVDSWGLGQWRGCCVCVCVCEFVLVYVCAHTHMHDMPCSDGCHDSFMSVA